MSKWVGFGVELLSRGRGWSNVVWHMVTFELVTNISLLGKLVANVCKYAGGRSEDWVGVNPSFPQRPFSIHAPLVSSFITQCKMSSFMVIALELFRPVPVKLLLLTYWALFASWTRRPLLCPCSFADQTWICTLWVIKWATLWEWMVSWRMLFTVNCL